MQPAPPRIATRSFDVAEVRADFPVLSRRIHGHPLVYLDNAATTQKPLTVLDRLDAYYRSENANVHRGVHTLSQEATDAYESVRGVMQRFLGAASPNEIVFTKGTTDSVNVVAGSMARGHLRRGDEILLTGMEHHSNIVPWQLAAEATGAVIKVVPVDDRGQMDMGAFQALLTPRTAVVAVVHVSNSLGTINPVEQIISDAHSMGAVVLVDGAQAVAHGPVDVRALDADFYCMSAHKVFGPTGTGVLYGKAEWLDRLPPYQGGGDMISAVSFEQTTYNEVPHKFEAGTPNIAGVIGMGAAIEYLRQFDIDEIQEHEDQLVTATMAGLEDLGGVRLIGTAARKTAVVSFLLEGLHPYDVATVMDRYGVAVRSGHHCTQPLMDHYGVPGTLRASFALYNTLDEVERLLASVEKARAFLS
ncbi:MAG: cysteine desulfurase [Rhodothermales bacterium]|nr:cysteine desulfurase [Rhodothermales bacterium]MBO6781246.1 cysteine desulfurase [Rhodothermales bacterium]